MTIDKTSAYRGDGNPKWRGDDAGYLARHVRVRTARGKASAHVCADCARKASEWAHVHDTDPFDVMNYAPMCTKCPRNYDRAVMPRGSKHGMAKLTEDQVRSIRARHAAGEMQITLAAEFGMTQGTVGKIVRRELWREVMPLCQHRSHFQLIIP